MSAAPRTAPAPLLVLGGIVSVQVGAALAVTLIPRIGAGGTVLMRLGFSAVLLMGIARPWRRRRTRAVGRAGWVTVVGFGVTLGLMNFTFYEAIARLPIGVAVTVEFVGPLALAAILSRRIRDVVAVLAAAAGIVLIAEMLQVPLASLDWLGLGLALGAGALWATYILLSGRTGATFPGVDGLAIALVVAGVVVIPMGVGSVPDWTGTALAKGLGIAVLSSLVPYSFELIALRSIRAGAFGILMSLEPGVAAVAGLVILHQHLSVVQVVGLALVVLASTIVLGARNRPAAPGVGTLDPVTLGDVGPVED